MSLVHRLPGPRQATLSKLLTYQLSLLPSARREMSSSLPSIVYGLRTDSPVRLTGAMPCLHAAPRVLLFLSAAN